MTPAYRYRARVVRVLDGDTYELDIDLGFHVSVRLPVRLYGWNCQELLTTAGVSARIRASELLASGPIVIETYKDRQSFARWLATVYVDGVDIGQALAKSGHATKAL